MGISEYFRVFGFAFVKTRFRRHIAGVRMFAFPYPLLLLAIWTGWLVIGDYVVLDSSVRQVLARGYDTTEGEIMRSQLGRGAFRRRGLDVGYSYSVNGLDYTGLRYRYDDRNGAFNYKSVTRAFPPGSTRTVYYNPANPADALLAPGLNGCDLLLALFAMPLNVATFMVWVAAFRSGRRRNGVAPAGGVRIFQHEGETRVRLACFSPLAAGFFGLAVAAIAAAMAIVFAAGFEPSLRLMSAVLILVVAAGMAAFLWTAQRHHSGRYDLRIHEPSQTLLLPPAGGRKEPWRVPRCEIVAVSMHRRVSHSPSGQHFSYVPALDCAAPNAERQFLPLLNWGWTEAKASAFAGWFSQQLGVPFKGIEEETQGASPLLHR
jgi:hypothetical protein